MPIATQVFQKSMALGFCLAILKNEIHTPWGLSSRNTFTTDTWIKPEEKEGRALRRSPKNQLNAATSQGIFERMCARN